MSWKVALASRIVVLALALALHGAITNPHASDELRQSGCSSSKPERLDLEGSFELRPEAHLTGWRQLVLRLNVWDTVHLLKVARCGYEDEQSHAFFPLLPGSFGTTA